MCMLVDYRLYDYVLYKSIYIDSESLSTAAMNNISDALTSMQVSISIVCSKLRITVIYFLSCVNKVSAKTLPFRKCKLYFS